MYAGGGLGRTDHVDPQIRDLFESEEAAALAVAANREIVAGSTRDIKGYGHMIARGDCEHRAAGVDDRAGDHNIRKLDNIPRACEIDHCRRRRYCKRSESEHAAERLRATAGESHRTGIRREQEQRRARIDGHVLAGALQDIQAAAGRGQRAVAGGRRILRRCKGQRLDVCVHRQRAAMRGIDIFSNEVTAAALRHDRESATLSGRIATFSCWLPLKY